MGLTEKIQEELKNAMKAKDGTKVSVLRMLIAALKNRRIELIKDLTDEQVLEVISSSVKRRNESIAAFRQGGRADLVAQEEAELAVLAHYLPAQLSAEEITALAREAVAESGAQAPKDVGLVMKALMPKIKGRGDGKLAKEIVERLLTP